MVVGRIINMKLISLTQGLFAQVDDEDYESLNQYKWCALKDNHTFYAVRALPRKNGKQKMNKMHIEIMGFKGIDHIDHNGLNNQKSNLRKANQSQQVSNTRKTRGTSFYKGVCWHKQGKKWKSSIGYANKSIFLGLFNNEIDAAKAYNKKAIELFGDFANLNEIAK